MQEIVWACELVEGVVWECWLPMPQIAWVKHLHCTHCQSQLLKETDHVSLFVSWFMEDMTLLLTTHILWYGIDWKDLFCNYKLFFYENGLVGTQTLVARVISIIIVFIKRPPLLCSPPSKAPSCPFLYLCSPAHQCTSHWKDNVKFVRFPWP